MNIIKYRGVLFCLRVKSLYYWIYIAIAEWLIEKKLIDKKIFDISLKDQEEEEEEEEVDIRN